MLWTCWRLVPYLTFYIVLIRQSTSDFTKSIGVRSQKYFVRWGLSQLIKSTTVPRIMCNHHIERSRSGKLLKRSPCSPNLLQKIITKTPHPKLTKTRYSFTDITNIFHHHIMLERRDLGTWRDCSSSIVYSYFSKLTSISIVSTVCHSVPISETVIFEVGCRRSFESVCSFNLYF